MRGWLIRAEIHMVSTSFAWTPPAAYASDMHFVKHCVFFSCRQSAGVKFLIFVIFVYFHPMWSFLIIKIAIYTLP